MKKYLSIMLTMVLSSIVLSSCKDKGEDMTYNPVIRFEYGVLSGNETDGYIVGFANKSHHASSFEWDFGDGCVARYSELNIFSTRGTWMSRTKTDEEPRLYKVSHYYSKPGTYRVTLVGENNLGIKNSITQTIMVEFTDTEETTDDPIDTPTEEPME